MSGEVPGSEGKEAVTRLEENLTVELKSDQKTLSDSDLVAAVVALANTEGGDLYIGVEDDGTVTGAQPQHQDTGRLASLVSARTVPPLGVRVRLLEEEGRRFVCIEVPKSTRIVATSQGLVQRRRLDPHGKPENVPFHPHEFAGRQADLGLLDYTALPLRGRLARIWIPWSVSGSERASRPTMATRRCSISRTTSSTGRWGSWTGTETDLHPRWPGYC